MKAAAKYDAFLLSRSDPARAVLEVENVAARNHWKFVVFGGAARDIILDGEKATPRDIDIVVDNVTIDDLQAEFGFRTKTAMGGLKGTLAGFPVDIWPLASTWAFSRMNLQRPPSFGLLMQTTMFNIEAVAIEPSIQTILHEGGFFECFDTRTLELNFERTAKEFSALTLVRAAVFSQKFGLRFGPKLTTFVHGSYTKFARRLKTTQESYYGREVLTADQLAEVLNPS